MPERAIQAVRNVLYNGAPGAKISGHLVGQFLAMLGIALVRIIGHQRVVVDEEVRLPDRVGVVGVGPAALGNAADEFPGARLVRAGVSSSDSMTPTD